MSSSSMSAKAGPKTASAPDSFFTARLAEADPDIAAAISGELGRQRHEIELIASENIVSRAVLEAQGSVLTNKYAEGYPGNRYTAAANGSMWWKASQSNAPKNCSARTSPTCRRIPAAR